MLKLTVSQLNRYVKSILEEDNHLQDMYLQGEVANFTNHFQSGHLYFNLKEKDATVRAVMFRGHAQHLQFEPEEGMQVLVRASASLYERQGSFQVYVTEMQPFGVGAMEVAFRQLKEKLEKQGYFAPEHKKPLPAYPETIGVVTSKTGAAYADIVKVIDKRYPVAKILFAPALVQGEQAPASLVRSLHALDGRCDVIILGRGGGSQEDLWAFNDARLADAVFQAKTPIISAVGHETDTTICDFVADLRAATPSAAAELATPSVAELRVRLDVLGRQISRLGTRQIQGQQDRIHQLEKLPVLKDPSYFIAKKQEALDFAAKNVYNIQTFTFQRLQEMMEEKAALLESLNPFSVLARGYGMVYKGDKPVHSVAQIDPQDKIEIKLEDGVVESTVQKIRAEGLV